MASTETLTSLAMLKINIDQGKDYLDYLRPFILQALVDHRPDQVTDQVVQVLLRRQFGLEIPPRTIQIVLKRLSRKYPLDRKDGIYHLTAALPDPGITHQKAAADRHINAVISGLLKFDNNNVRTLTNTDEAVTALCGFLSEFNIPCLRAYLLGTTIPPVDGKQPTHIILVSEYVLHLERNDPERFSSFMVLVQGHMLANALLCPDLQDAPRTYKGVTFFLDTPLLVQRLGFEGDRKKYAVKELITLIRNLGGDVATFSHSHEELGRVLVGAANHIDSPNDRGGAIILEARKNGTTKSDLLLQAGQLEEQLADAEIEVQSTPGYIKKFQIDEEVFGQVLEDEVYYFNPRAKEYDINSVRSIYALRTNTAPLSIEKCKAVLVSSNSAFARAAYEYGKQHDESREISSVITDFSLANIAWLKAPMGAPSIPMRELLSYSYAALQPSKALLDKYLREIDKLQRQSKISVRDHQLLRSSTIAQEELMRLTLGEEAALTEETVSETLRRVTTAIKEEETEKIAQEKLRHQETQNKLAQALDQRKIFQARTYWRCRRNATIFGWIFSCVAGVFLIIGIAGGLGMLEQFPAFGWCIFLGSIVLTIATLSNLFWGTTVKECHESIRAKCLTYFLRKEAKGTGITLEDS